MPNAIILQRGYWDGMGWDEGGLTGIKSEVVESRSDVSLLVEVPQLVLGWWRVLAEHDHVCSRIFLRTSHVQHFAMHLTHHVKLTPACHTTR